MGDTFEVAIDVKATLGEAPRLAGTVIQWLTAEGIIDATPTDDGDVWGAGCYRPGPDNLLAAPHPHRPYAIGFAESGLGRLKVLVGPTAFVPIQGEPAVCPHLWIRRHDHRPRDGTGDERAGALRRRAPDVTIPSKCAASDDNGCATTQTSS